MKTWLTLLLLATLLGPLDAQEGPITVKNFKSYPSYPLFGLDSLKMNSVSAREKGKPVVIVYFSPTCHHCQAFTEEITSHLKEFKGVRFLMVSAYPLQEIRTFASAYGLVKLPQFMLGWDPQFNMGAFFGLKELPGVFVYGKDGQLAAAFEGTVPMDKLQAAVKGDL
jgi:thioredoxin-like negative regulator of GroEL